MDLLYLEASVSFFQNETEGKHGCLQAQIWKYLIVTTFFGEGGLTKLSEVLLLQPVAFKKSVLGFDLQVIDSIGSSLVLLASSVL